MRARAGLVLLLFVLAGCGGGGEGASAPEAATTEPQGERGPHVVIAADEGEVIVPVEVADSPGERQVGLMHRESLPEDAGMIFVFEEDNRGGFWMKDTLIPLSIAFADAEGTILAILDMEPCTADPCEVYDPGVAYRTALEVNQGAFERWGVEEGDRLRLEG